MTGGLPSLQATTLATQTQWFDDFDSWQGEAFWTDLQAHGKSLAANDDATVAQIGRRLNGIVVGGVSLANASAFISISEVEGEINSLASRLKSNTDLQIKSIIEREMKRDNAILAQIVELLSKPDGGGETADEQDGEDGEEASQPLVGRQAAFDAFAGSIRAQARSTVSGHPVNHQSRNGRIVAMLGNQRLPAEELSSLGASLQAQVSARRFVDPVRRYFDELPSRYSQFRRERVSEGRWYRKDGFGQSDIAPLEVDVILLALLWGMRALLRERRIARAFAGGSYAMLKPAYERSQTQIAVDEATDFSPIQLACMAALCDPSTQSFVACGDFNQRITEWGSRSTDDLKWVFPKIDIRPVNITYRHSRQLRDLARTIVLLSSPDGPEAHLPQRVENDGVAPLLVTNMSERRDIAEWLAARIGEIERFKKALPTIAVLVSEEADVVPLANALNEFLASKNIRVVPCSGGNMAGQDNDVRVFDVRHIKGLEFEAVFFIGIDRLAELQPDLFDKYLYVGTTRAAMYLGLVTGAPSLPARIRSLKSHFKERWP